MRLSWLNTDGYLFVKGIRRYQRGRQKSLTERSYFTPESSSYASINQEEAKDNRRARQKGTRRKAMQFREY